MARRRPAPPNNRHATAQDAIRASGVTRRPKTVARALGYMLFNPYLMGTRFPNPGASGGGTTNPTGPAAPLGPAAGP